MRFTLLVALALLPAAQAAETCATADEMLQIKAYLRCQTSPSLGACTGLDQAEPPLRDQYLSILDIIRSKPNPEARPGLTYAIPFAARLHDEWRAGRRIENPYGKLDELKKQAAELAKEVVPYEREMKSLTAQLEQGKINESDFDQFKDKWKDQKIDEKMTSFHAAEGKYKHLAEALRLAKRRNQRVFFEPFIVLGNQGRIDLANVDYEKLNRGRIFNEPRNYGIVRNAHYLLNAMEEELKALDSSDNSFESKFRENVAKRFFDQKMEDKKKAKISIRYAPSEPVPQDNQEFEGLAKEDKDYYLAQADIALVYVKERAEKRAQNIRRAIAHDPGPQSALARAGELEKGGDMQKFIAWSEATGEKREGCPPFKALHQKIFAKPKASSLECKHDRFILAMESEDGQSRHLEAQLVNPTKKIRQIHFKKLGGGWAGNVYFDNKGNFKDYDTLFTAKLVVPVKRQLAEAKSCCQQTGEKLEACLALFNYEAPKAARNKAETKANQGSGDPKTESAL